MPRVKAGVKRRQRHKKILGLAKGYRGTRSKLFGRAHEAVRRAGEHAFAGRRLRRRNVRRLWIVRLSGALSEYGINYSRFINSLQKSKIDLNRKTLSEMAINDPTGFKSVVEKVLKTEKS